MGLNSRVADAQQDPSDPTPKCFQGALLYSCLVYMIFLILFYLGLITHLLPIVTKNFSFSPYTLELKTSSFSS